MPDMYEPTLGVLIVKRGRGLRRDGVGTSATIPNAVNRLFTVKKVPAMSFEYAIRLAQEPDWEEGDLPTDYILLEKKR